VARRAAAPARVASARRRIARGAVDVRLTTHPGARVPGRTGAAGGTAPGCAAASAEAGSFDGALAFALLQAQCDLGGRVPGSTAHAAARELLLSVLSASVDEVATQQWTQRVDRGVGAGAAVPMTNILGRLRGSGRRDGCVMLATHWDSRPAADADPDPTRRSEPVVGASDGASGVAVLLHLAQVLARRRPSCDVVLALFDGEDLGEHFYGSRVFARSLRGPAAAWRPSAAVVVDMVGGAGLRCATELSSVRRHPDLWQSVHACAAAQGFADRFNGPERRITDDHAALSRAGVPSILLIDADYAPWHTTHDVPERCSAASLEAVGRVLQCWVARA
jgi:hypothetical protein